MNTRSTHAMAVLALLCLLATPRLAQAQHETGADVFTGEKAYQTYCANCHGAAGNQIANVDIGRGVFRRPYSDEDLVGIVMRGIPGTPMPATPNMTREQADQIVGYLRSRAQAKDVTAGGDAARGRALLAGDGQCLTCHRVQGEGSRRGPDLTRIGAQRTPEQLARALLDPDAEVQPANRTYHVELRNGRAATGRLLNQDAYSVQLLTDEEELRSFQKSDLARHGFVPSPMPSMRGRWNDQQLADVVSYLVSLRGSQRP
jgi:cytochrome c oxidase cbb3-type subunit III